MVGDPYWDAEVFSVFKTYEEVRKYGARLGSVSVFVYTRDYIGSCHVYNRQAMGKRGGKQKE